MSAVVPLRLAAEFNQIALEKPAAARKLSLMVIHLVARQAGVDHERLIHPKLYLILPNE